jgi:hypothetical protein
MFNSDDAASRVPAWTLVTTAGAATAESRASLGNWSTSDTTTLTPELAATAAATVVISTLYRMLGIGAK